MKKQKDGNFLEYIPVISQNIRYEIENGKVTILKENRGFFNRIAQKLFKKPPISYIHLDDMGNFLWPLFDGHRNIIELADLVKAEYGEKAEPLYRRLVQYIKTLNDYGFIELL